MPRQSTRYSAFAQRSARSPSPTRRSFATPQCPWSIWRDRLVVCRPSLPLAPGVLVSAPSISGAGSGKGLLVRAICEIAFGQPPQAFTGCRDIAELEKRISAALIEAAPVLFIDNVNDTALRSDLLASVLTEPSVRARRLGESQMLPLNPTAFVAVTGNGVTLSEDLVRRFITVELDPRMDDPENRPFAPGFVASVSARRPELLAAALTIWLLGPPKRLRSPTAASSAVTRPGRAGSAIHSWRWAAAIPSSALRRSRRAIHSASAPPRYLLLGGSITRTARCGRRVQS